MPIQRARSVALHERTCHGINVHTLGTDGVGNTERHFGFNLLLTKRLDGLYIFFILLKLFLELSYYYHHRNAEFLPERVQLYSSSTSTESYYGLQPLSQNIIRKALHCSSQFELSFIFFFFFFVFLHLSFLGFIENSGQKRQSCIGTPVLMSLTSMDYESIRNQTTTIL